MFLIRTSTTFVRADRHVFPFAYESTAKRAKRTLKREFPCELPRDKWNNTRSLRVFSHFNAEIFVRLGVASPSVRRCFLFFGMFKRRLFSRRDRLRARWDLAELFSSAQILRLERNARFLYHLLSEFLSFSFRRSVYERRLRSSSFTVVLFPFLALHDATTPFSCFRHFVNWRFSHPQCALYVARGFLTASSKSIRASVSTGKWPRWTATCASYATEYSPTMEVIRSFRKATRVLRRVSSAFPIPRGFSMDFFLYYRVVMRENSKRM